MKFKVIVIILYWLAISTGTHTLLNIEQNVVLSLKPESVNNEKCVGILKMVKSHSLHVLQY